MFSLLKSKSFNLIEIYNNLNNTTNQLNIILSTINSHDQKKTLDLGDMIIDDNASKMDSFHDSEDVLEKSTEHNYFDDENMNFLFKFLIESLQKIIVHKEFENPAGKNKYFYFPIIFYGCTYYAER